MWGFDQRRRRVSSFLSFCTHFQIQNDLWMNVIHFRDVVIDCTAKLNTIAIRNSTVYNLHQKNPDGRRWYSYLSCFSSTNGLLRWRIWFVNVFARALAWSNTCTWLQCTIVCLQPRYINKSRALIEKSKCRIEINARSLWCVSVGVSFSSIWFTKDVSIAFILIYYRCDLRYCME